MADIQSGWSWFTAAENDAPEDGGGPALAFARCFRGPDGERALKHLRAMTLEQSVGPAASDAMLRHLEGQRQLVAHIQGLIERGRGPNPTDT